MYHATTLNQEEAILGPFFADQYSSSVSSTESTVFVFAMRRILKIAQCQFIFPRITNQLVEMIDSSQLHQFSVCPIDVSCIHLVITYMVHTHTIHTSRLAYCAKVDHPQNQDEKRLRRHSRRTLY